MSHLNFKHKNSAVNEREARANCRIFKKGMLAAPIAIFGLLFGAVFLMQLISLNTPTGAVVVFQACYDSDGVTASLPGTVALVDASGGEQTRADVCVSKNVVSELTCDGSQLKKVNISCNECVSDENGIGYCIK